MLSKNAKNILKYLYKKEKNYKSSDNKGKETAKADFDELKELLPDNSFIHLNQTLNYLLSEKYIFNHIIRTPYHVDEKNIDIVEYVIGDKGIVYLKTKNYKLIAKILPLAFSAVGLVISIIALLN
ncbi:hypothetical protein [Mammaliicoccus fleurettii]|uniref:hypothetical protein n=1 Tax=Mammaliicoccus fleurettii TaxID=150056 RepID=UPI000993090F|nr:hypothetical protein [Mammaliicoccus fleurettii]OOV78891.1 hypothetical protein B2G86_00775 [Mammaliicoccus fleurettii]